MAPSLPPASIMLISLPAAVPMFLDPQVCQILFARPTDEIVGGDHQMAEAMAQVIVEARKDRDTIG
jgi:hypothetical protein